MNKNALKSEVLLTSKYCLIIKQILYTHKELSINKMLLFAYLIKNNNNYLSALYTANTTNDTVIKAISQIAGDYSDYCKNIKYIIAAIHMLAKNGDIIVHETILLYGENNLPQSFYGNNFIKKAIEESRNYSDRQFLKEVINNV